jgi:hypothetical protein
MKVVEEKSKSKNTRSGQIRQWLIVSVVLETIEPCLGGLGNQDVFETAASNNCELWILLVTRSYMQKKEALLW